MSHSPYFKENDSTTGYKTSFDNFSHLRKADVASDVRVFSIRKCFYLQHFHFISFLHHYTGVQIQFGNKTVLLLALSE